MAVRMAPMARKVVSETLSLIFFGEALCELALDALTQFLSKASRHLADSTTAKEVRFSSASRSQVRELEFTLMALRVTPSFMKP